MVVIGVARKNGTAALTKEQNVMQVERRILGNKSVELWALVAVPQKLSGRECASKVYKRLLQLHVGKEVWTLDSDPVEEEPSQVKASKRLKQVEEKKRIEAQCDGHLLEDEKVKPNKVTQRQTRMAKDDAQRIAIEASRVAAWRSASHRKDIVFLSKKSMGTIFGLRNQLVIRSRN